MATLPPGVEFQFVVTSDNGGSRKAETTHSGWSRKGVLEFCNRVTPVDDWVRRANVDDPVCRRVAQLAPEGSPWRDLGRWAVTSRGGATRGVVFSRPLELWELPDWGTSGIPVVTTELNLLCTRPPAGAALPAPIDAPAWLAKDFLAGDLRPSLNMDAFGVVRRVDGSGFLGGVVSGVGVGGAPALDLDFGDGAAAGTDRDERGQTFWHFTS
jgi:hypothetical protein